MPGRSETSRRKRRLRPGAAKAIAPNPFLALMPRIQRDIDERLEAFFEEKLRAVATQGPEVTAMLAALMRLGLRGGKRIRPALLYLGFRVARPRGSPDVALHAGLVLELLHTYLLVHDDWMDGDSLRRGGPTVHAELARRLGDAHRGASVGVLAGDFAAALAAEVLATLPIPSDRVGAVLECYARMQVDVIAGQVLDVAGRDQDPELVYALKTGSYTVRGPLRMGALLGRASPAVLRALDRFAAPAGVAFQLADDLLSAYGSTATTGKTLGNDLRAGKRTPLVLSGMKRAKGGDLRLLKQVFGKKSASDAAVGKALLVLDRVGARRQVEERIEELVKNALEGLGKAIPREGRELLEGASLALTARRR
jgi:geranylgeranyl diphosphate synthase, type I